MNRTVLAFGSAAVCLAAAIAAGVSLGAQTTGTHGVVVTLDDTSVGDLRILEHAFGDGVDGEEVSPSLRKVAMGAIGEVAVALETRLDAFNVLTLDDGTQVPLLDEDEIEVKAIGKEFQPGATISFQTVCSKRTLQCHRTPVSITVVRGDGTKMCSNSPPKHLGHVTSEKKCAIIKK